MKSLSNRQHEALIAIAKFWKMGRPPVTAELLAELGLATVAGLQDLLKQLTIKGYITVSNGPRGQQRLIELTPQGKAEAGFGLPILGSIPAGTLSEALQECDEWLEGAETLLKSRPGDFGLRVRGDSMIGDGILDGDKVLIRPNMEWRSGEIVAAQVHNDSGFYEGSLKHIEKSKNGKSIILRASNPAYDDMEFDARRVSVSGVYRGLIRTFE